MGVDAGFDALQKAVDVDRSALVEGRRRRDVFVAALKSCADVRDAWPSGSLARRTHKDPLHDVDVVAVFDGEAHPTWGLPGGSAHDSLEHLRTLIKDCLGSSGTHGIEVRRAELRNHSVKCFLDDPGDANAFTVDVTPALERVPVGLTIPERESQAWIASHPKLLIERVAARQSDWPRFVQLVRVLKRWNSDHGDLMKSLVVELLALDHLPEESNRGLSVQRFFSAAAQAVLLPVEDPAGLCGEVQPDLDRVAASERLREAGEKAWRAQSLYESGEEDESMCLWREVFGGIFPAPPGGCGGGVKTLPAVPLVRPIRDTPQG